MKIEILGSGCPKCRELEAVTREAVNQTGVKAEIVKVTDMDDIIDFGVMMTPALVIDGEVKVAGRVAGPAEIVEWINGGQA